MSTPLRRLATTAVTGIAGVAALVVAVSGLPQTAASAASASGAETYAALRANADAAAQVVRDVEAHGRNAEGYEGDEAPAGVDVHDQVTTAALMTAADSIADPGQTSGIGNRVSTGCSDDGVSGNRVQAVYVVASDRPDRYDAVVGSLRQYAAGVDAVFLASAAEHGGRRQIRWVHDASCQLSVLHAVVAPSATASFGSLTSALAAQGYTRGDRKYLLYTDAAVLCGVANVYTDNTAAQSNANNGGYAQYARVDAPCWAAGDHSVEAHELTHTLGAVLSFAPHVSAAGHCTDESDVMCYVDGPGVVMTQSCPTTHEKLLDCNGDDYFNVNPAPGSALARNWNAANSSFLYDPPAPLISGGSYDPASQTVTVTPRVLSGQGWRIDWSGAGCTPATARTLSDSATAASVHATCPSGGTITATLTQQDGRAAVVTVAADATPAPAPAPAQATTAPTTPAPATGTAPTATVPALSLSGTPTSVQPGGRVTLTGRLTVNGAAGPRTRVDLQRRVGSSWGRVATTWSNTLGVMSFPQTVGATTAYRLVTVGAVPATSGTVTVTVATKVQVHTSGLKVRGTVKPVKRGTLVRLLSGTHLVAVARTDARGAFKLTLPRAGKRYHVVVKGAGAPLTTVVSLRAAARR